MNFNNILEKHQHQKKFQIVIGFIAVVLIIKIGFSGFEFGHWLKNR